jgi:hypothetical protein
MPGQPQLVLPAGGAVRRSAGLVVGWLHVDAGFVLCVEPGDYVRENGSRMLGVPGRVLVRTGTTYRSRSPWFSQHSAHTRHSP